MENIYEAYKVKSAWTNWRKFSAVNKSIRQKTKVSKPINQELFALRIFLNEQYTKWYDLSIVGRANQAVQAQMDGLKKIANAIEYSQEEIKSLADKSLPLQMWGIVLLRTLGLDYLFYNEGYGLRSGYPLQGIRGFIFYFSCFYLIPLLLFFQLNHWFFDLFIVASLLYNVINSVRWIRLNQFSKYLDEIFAQTKKTLLNKID